MAASKESPVSWLVSGIFISYTRDEGRESNILLNRHSGTLGSGDLIIVDGSMCARLERTKRKIK